MRSKLVLQPAAKNNRKGKTSQNYLGRQRHHWFSPARKNFFQRGLEHAPDIDSAKADLYKQRPDHNHPTVHYFFF
jgi:hypothetical protein